MAITLTLEEFKKKYYTMKTRELAKELKVSIPTVLKVVKEYGLKKKLPGRLKRSNKIKIIGEKNV